MLSLTRLQHVTLLCRLVTRPRHFAFWDAYELVTICETPDLSIQDRKTVYERTLSSICIDIFNSLRWFHVRTRGKIAWSTSEF